MAVFRQITPGTQGVICDFGKSRFTEMVDAEKKPPKLYTESFFICIFAPIIVY